MTEHTFEQTRWSLEDLLPAARVPNWTGSWLTWKRRSASWRPAAINYPPISL